MFVCLFVLQLRHYDDAGEVMFTLEQCIKAQREKECLTLLIL